jgi:hypothetical protein
MGAIISAIIIFPGLLAFQPGLFGTQFGFSISMVNKQFKCHGRFQGFLPYFLKVKALAGTK